MSMVQLNSFRLQVDLHKVLSANSQCPHPITLPDGTTINVFNGVGPMGPRYEIYRFPASAPAGEGRCTRRRTRHRTDFKACFHWDSRVDSQASPLTKCCELDVNFASYLWRAVDSESPTLCRVITKKVIKDWLKWLPI